MQMTLQLLDLPDTVLRSIRRQLNESNVLHFRTVSKQAAQSHLVLADPVLAAKLALIVGNEKMFRQLVPPFVQVHHDRTQQKSMVCDFVRLLVRMDVPRPCWAVLRRWTQGRTALRPAQYVTMVAYASTRGSGEALNVLLAWKTRTGQRMLTLEPTPPRGKYRFEAALVHPQLTSRPDFADWMLMHLEDFLTANVRPALLLYAMATEVAGFLKTLHRVFPVSMPPWSHASLEYTCLTRCKDLMYELFVSISKAREPVLMFRAILAALLIGRVDWRPDHPLVSRTAVVVDFGPELSPTAGIAALRALLVQSAGGDAAVADALIVGFEAMPPVVVRNAMVSFAPATTSNFPRRSLDLFSAVLSIDPPPLSTMLDHEAVRLAVSSSPSGDSQESTLLVPHNKVPLWVPRFGTESSLNPVISAIVRCEGCRLRLGQHFEGMDEAAACEWGVVVDVPTLLSFQ